MNNNEIIADFEEKNILNIEKVIETYNHYIYSIIEHSISNQEDIEELLSDVFLSLWICAISLIMLSGGFFTVNAATNGKLVQDIKELVTVTIVKQDGTTEKIEGKTRTDEQGNTWLEYEKKEEDWEFIMNVDRTELDKNNLEINAKITEDGASGETNIEIKNN